MYETAKETLMYRTVLWTLLERERVGRFGPPKEEYRAQEPSGGIIYHHTQ